MSSGCRITHHLRDWDAFAISSSSSSSKFQLNSLIKPYPANHKLLHLQLQNHGALTTTRRRRFLRITSPLSSSFRSAFPIISCLHSKLPSGELELPVLRHSPLSQKEDDRELSSEGLSSVAGGIVALGKFDALHIGHRELAIQASKVGAPFLLSFVGMAEVLGWAPRAPIVAQCDRKRVLSSWAPFCGNVAPKEFLIDFAGVRHLTPCQFVEKLSKELGVRGVVAGENYRFGYKAAGDASELVRLCAEFGIRAYIINSVMDMNQDSGNSLAPDNKKERGQVSSTRVRCALSNGDMNYVSELLGRQHRLFLSAQNKEDFVVRKNSFAAPKSCLLNLPPKEGLYENCSLIINDDNQIPCRLTIGSTHIRVETDDDDHYIRDASRDIPLLGVEFRG